MAEFLSSSSTSEFEGFSDEDNGSSQRSSPKSYADPILSPPNLLAAPPTSNPDGSLRTFASLEAALSYCQTWARDHGYAVRKCRTKTRGKERVLYKVYIECECAGKKRGTEVPTQYRVRKDQASKACQCPFRGSITERDGFWSIAI